MVKVKISSSMHDYVDLSSGSEMYWINMEWNFRNHPLSWKQFNHFALQCIDFFVQRKSPYRPIFLGQIVRDRWQSCLRCCLCPDPSCMMLSAGVLFTGGRPRPGLQGCSELEHESNGKATMACWRKGIEIAVVDSCDDLSPTYLRLGRKLLWLRKTLNSKLWNCWFPKKWNLLQCYPQTSDSPRISESFSCDWNFNALGRIIVKLIVLRFFFCELPLAIHSCAKVAWSLGAASLSMTGWDLGWLPTRSGGLRTFVGRHDNLQKSSFQHSPFQKPPMIGGHFFVQSSTLPGWFIAVWLRDLRCIGFSRKINDPLQPWIDAKEEKVVSLIMAYVSSCYKFILKKRRFVLLSKFTPPNASVTSNFGDLLILRWSRLEIPWKVFQSWCFLHPFLILFHVSLKEFGKWPDTLPPICIKINEKDLMGWNF